MIKLTNSIKYIYIFKQVFIFKPSVANRVDLIKEVKINKIKTFFGSTNGEYFGCALEAIDLNNDGMDVC